MQPALLDVDNRFCDIEKCPLDQLSSLEPSTCHPKDHVHRCFRTHPLDCVECERGVQRLTVGLKDGRPLAIASVRVPTRLGALLSKFGPEPAIVAYSRPSIGAISANSPRNSTKFARLHLLGRFRQTMTRIRRMPADFGRCCVLRPNFDAKVVLNQVS